MEYIRGKTDFVLKNTCVTLGKFDGLHAGHQVLLKKLEEFEAQGYKTVMFTFDFLPCNILKNTGAKLIYDEEEKLSLLRRRGPQTVISYPFTKELAMTGAEDFVKDILIDRLDAKIIVVGEDFCFGKDRQGNVDFLKSLAEKYGYRVIVCKKLSMDGRIVSSSLIRSEIENGNMETAEKMLNRSFFGITENH